jgi:RimJ/RimL family protein N-acetyltransferase
MSTGSPTDGVVTLRQWRPPDAQVIVECVDGDPEITRWLDRVPQPYTLDDSEAYIGGLGEQSFAITDAATGRVLGSIGVTWNETGDVGEIGYWLRADARGHGITTRALALICAWGFERDGTARLQLRADIENTASRRVAEKAGFAFEGVLRNAYWNPRIERHVSWAMYSLLPGELA